MMDRVSFELHEDGLAAGCSAVDACNADDRACISCRRGAADGGRSPSPGVVIVDAFGVCREVC